MVKGLSKTPGDPWDNVFAEDIVNHLFEDPKKPGSGSDLVALNIQRGRDHGIPGYNALRELCGKPKANNFDDLSDTMVPGKQLKLKRKFFLSSIPQKNKNKYPPFLPQPLKSGLIKNKITLLC